ncbi:hypothetical protein G6L68_23915 [Agrobacterium fabrum]|nr:hypothetical protein [Agrobacterium fabrum]
MQFVAACLEPGAIISEVARDAGVHVSQLFVGATSSAGSRSRTSRRQHLGAGDRCRNRAGRPCCTTGTAPTSPFSSEAKRCNDRTWTWPQYPR